MVVNGIINSHMEEEKEVNVYFTIEMQRIEGTGIQDYEA